MLCKHDWTEAFGDPRKIVLDWSPDFPTDSMRPSPNYFGHLLRLMTCCACYSWSWYSGSGVCQSHDRGLWAQCASVGGRRWSVGRPEREHSDTGRQCERQRVRLEVPHCTTATCLSRACQQCTSQEINIINTGSTTKSYLYLIYLNIRGKGRKPLTCR